MQLNILFAVNVAAAGVGVRCLRETPEVDDEYGYVVPRLPPGWRATTGEKTNQPRHGLGECEDVVLSSHRCSSYLLIFKKSSFLHAKNISHN